MRAKLRSLAARAVRERPMFVFVNIVVNLLLLGRSYVTMQVLDYRELGLAALLQTMVLLIGVLQFGFLNGGYRLLCSAEGAEAERINNLVYSFLGILALAVLLVTGGALLFIDGAEATLIALLGVAGGVATLGRTWISNQMVAMGALKRINLINLLAGIASVAVLGFVPIAPLAACLAAVIAQPLVFIGAAGIVDRRLWPSGIELSAGLARAVLRAGFITYLTGIFLQLNLQLERWYVTAFLGLESLGHLYLALLFVTLFQMIPASLDQIYLPAIVRSHDRDDRPGVRHGMRQYFRVVLGYCVLAALAVALLAKPVTALILPGYVGDIRYLYLLAPGLIVFTLSSPFAMLFSVLIRYRFYFLSYGAGSVAALAVFGYAALMNGALDLDGVMVARSLVYVLISIVIMIGFRSLTRNLPAFRFYERHPREAGA